MFAQNDHPNGNREINIKGHREHSQWIQIAET